MTLPLHDIEEDFQPLADSCDEEDATQSFEDLERVLGAIQAEVNHKVLSVAKVVTSIEAEAELLETHARLASARAQARRRRADFLKRWMRLELEAVGLDCVRDPFVTVWLQRSPSLRSGSR